MRAWLNAIAIAMFLAAPGLVGSGAAGTASAPPHDLLALERQVGLRVAHVRDEGPVEAAKRKLLYEAQQREGRGEAALKAGDYESAREQFERALDLLNQIGL